MRARRLLYGFVGVSLLVGLSRIPTGALAKSPSGSALVPGTVITVNTFDDELQNNGQCSLREAVIAANTDTSQGGCPAGTGLDTIVLSAGTYEMWWGSSDDQQDPRSGDYEVTGPTIIRGAGRDVTIIDGGGDRIFEIIGSVTIQDLTVQGGSVDAPYWEGGSGILNYGNLILENVSVANNGSDITGGGGLANKGDVTIHNSLFFSNNDYGGGSAISNEGDARIFDTIFLENYNWSDGVIANYPEATLQVENAQFLNNGTANDASVLYVYGTVTIRDTLIDCFGQTAVEAGAIWVKDGYMLLEDVTIQNCEAEKYGGAVRQDAGTLEIVRTVIRDATANYGGAIALLGGSLEVRESLLSGNNAMLPWGWGHGGAAIHVAGGSGLVINSTIVDNQADTSGAVNLEGGVLELRSVTLARNSGGGLVVAAGGTARVHNSILAENGPDCTGGLGGIVSLGYNLVGNAAGCGWVEASMDDIGTASQPIDPKLGALEDNGGPTWTVELQTGSPAIDDGDNANCPTTDQRGFPRPKDGNQDGHASCDKGPYEVQGKAAPEIPPQPALFLPFLLH